MTNPANEQFLERANEEWQQAKADYDFTAMRAVENRLRLHGFGIQAKALIDDRILLEDHLNNK